MGRRGRCRRKRKFRGFRRCRCNPRGSREVFSSKVLMMTGRRESGKECLQKGQGQPGRLACSRGGAHRLSGGTLVRKSGSHRGNGV